MLFISFMKWWYGAGWILAWKRLGQRIDSVSRGFSIKLLFRTLFSPWKRVTANKGRGLDAQIHAGLDNLVGRVVGFSVRSIVLLAAGVAILVTAIFGFILLIAWPLLPPLVVTLIGMGVFIR